MSQQKWALKRCRPGNREDTWARLRPRSGSTKGLGCFTASSSCHRGNLIGKRVQSPSYSFRIGSVARTHLLVRAPLHRQKEAPVDTLDYLMVKNS